MSKKSQLLEQADQLERMAKDERVRNVNFYDLAGKIQTVSRYRLPQIAEGMRLEAALMAE